MRGPQNQGSALAALLSVIVVVVGSLAFCASVAAETETDAATGCSVTIDDPHFSTGANGVIVKSRFDCSRAATIVQETQLYWCGEKVPQKNEVWLGQNCNRRGYNIQDVTFGAGGGTGTRYAPPSGGGSTLRGWYSGCVSWQVNYGTFHTTFSTHPYYHSGGGIQPAP